MRAFASDAVHLADVPDDFVIPRMLHAGHEFNGVPLPAAMLCGAVLRKKFNYTVAVRMNDDAKINCRACRKIGELTK